MTLTFEVVYEDGAFRPLVPLPEGLFKEGERLVLVIDQGGDRVTVYRKAEVADINASEVNHHGDRS